MTLSHVTALKQTGRGAPCLLRLWLVCLLQTDPAETKSKLLHPFTQPAKIKFFFSLWEEPLCSGHAALIQNHGQHSSTEGGRWQQAEEGEISAPPLVDSTNSPYSQRAERFETLGVMAKIMRRSVSEQGNE